MNVNRIVNMVIALVLRRFINMGISKAMALVFRKGRATTQLIDGRARSLPDGAPDTPRRAEGPSATDAAASPQPVVTRVQTASPSVSEARAARRARVLARRAAGRANGR